ncbi:hypothetical protein BN938_0590 [Mucinivorans hirudinis]|uniref:DUF3244 domain-containing protein n=1 Tax=Mucinivorans hirudinis TaxID=1433126 RepID=A0A060R6N1_9BACT|nr:hypothetical protein BN938_0590 [Mucinivorans hirudinis]
MKKRLLLAAFLLTFLFVRADNVQTIDWNQKSTDPKAPRSLVVLPEGKYDPTNNVLWLKLASYESYTLEITDCNGYIVFQSLVVTDGTNQSYILPQLEEGIYNISLAGSSRNYVGYFTV